MYHIQLQPKGAANGVRRTSTWSCKRLRSLSHWWTWPQWHGFL